MRRARRRRTRAQCDRVRGNEAAAWQCGDVHDGMAWASMTVAHSQRPVAPAGRSAPCEFVADREFARLNLAERIGGRCGRGTIRPDQRRCRAGGDNGLRRIGIRAAIAASIAVGQPGSLASSPKSVRPTSFGTTDARRPRAADWWPGTAIQHSRKLVEGGRNHGGDACVVPACGGVNIMATPASLASRSSNRVWASRRPVCVAVRCGANCSSSRRRTAPATDAARAGRSAAHRTSARRERGPAGCRVPARMH